MGKSRESTRKREFRKLEDLNLIDNFLFQEMLSQEEDGEEFARILLSTILGKQIRKVKIVSQKNILGVDTDKHGIRLDAYIEDISNENGENIADAEISHDIYDVEPNNIYEKESLPKRMRYYHGLIDTRLLSSGAGYEELPRVVIIVILPYDPFNKNRMFYTIQNHCVEDAAIPYDDGACKIFLNTKGTEGNPRQELADMLKYIEKATDDNVTNKDIASIQTLVKKVKRKKEVGINYMKSWEIEKIVRDEGYSDGFNDGSNKGNQEMQEKMNKLTICLAEAKRTEDIIKAAHDKEYQERLFKEFNL